MIVSEMTTEELATAHGTSRYTISSFVNAGGVLDVTGKFVVLRSEDGRHRVVAWPDLVDALAAGSS